MAAVVLRGQSSKLAIRALSEPVDILGRFMFYLDFRHVCSHAYVLIRCESRHWDREMKKVNNAAQFFKRAKHTVRTLPESAG